MIKIFTFGGLNNDSFNEIHDNFNLRQVGQDYLCREFD